MDQIGTAVTELDHVTQQNAALVEEMAAAASSLRSQAQELVSTVSVFKVEGQDFGLATAPARTPAAAPQRPRPATPAAASPRREPSTVPAAARAAPVQPLPKPAAKSSDDGDWETF